MKFLFGIAFGALGLWAYQSGKLQSLMGNAPEPAQVVSTVLDKVQRANAPDIAIPTAAEVAGRPAEPLPHQS